LSPIWQQWQALAASLPHKALGLAAWLLVVAVVFGLLERRFPIRPQRFLRPNMAQDIGYYFLGGLLPPFLTVMATAALAWFVSGLVPAGFYVWVASLPFAVRVGAMVLLGDVAFYWAHRWSHENEWLWRMHAVHHSPTALDWLVNTRVHPLDLVFARAVSAVPIVVLGIRQGNDGLDDLPGAHHAVGVLRAHQPEVAPGLAGAGRRDTGLPPLASRQHARHAEQELRVALSLDRSRVWHLSPARAAVPPVIRRRP
jgi:sterol desaturase/sphingolipid hydroxylase (fatty acid hydroxylase superfamily)